MLVTISIMSKKKGEIKKFLDKYLGETNHIDKQVIEWIYVYRDELKAIDIINLIVENIGSYSISLWVQIGDDDIIQVTDKNQRKITDKILKTLDNKELVGV